MPTYFQKPENALKRANEFIEVNKKESALEVLNDVIRSRKHRTWTKTHQLIMEQFTSLCVDLQKSSFAKDGLYQYRNICKEVAPNSFEHVVKKFLGMAEEKANKAREESDQVALLKVEDLDYVQTPESLLLSTVSGEGAKERTDRVVLTPWVKFLWESYRNMLELLKNNSNVQTVYADVAKDAFKFCINYQRRTEFRKLCDILRNHLQQAQKYQNQTYSLKFDIPETIQCLVDVRFEQLESSISVDLWQEAFKAIEEIHNLINMTGKSPKPGLLDNFYAKQAKVYWMAKNKLFHAAALHKVFTHRKEQKKTVTHEEAQATASQVLLATLCVDIEPIPSKTAKFLEIDNTSRDKARRLAALLRMTTPPSRALLIKDMIQYNVLQHVPAELLQLYQWLEEEFNPLLLSKRVLPVIEGLEGGLQQYVEPLKEIVLTRLIKQVAQVFETIELSRLAELAPFTTPTQLEKAVVETAHSNGIQVRIDHHTKSLSFGTDVSFYHREEAAEGPHMQSMPSEVLCNQLSMVFHALRQVVSVVSLGLQEEERDVRNSHVLKDYQQHLRPDRRAILQRKQLIEARKEFIENKSRAKEHKVETERRLKAEQDRKAERERLDREARTREEEHTRRELDEIKRLKAQERLEALKKTSVGARALGGISSQDLEQMDVDEIFSKQLKQLEKEKREKDTKLKTQEKKIDYFERAKRLVEVPLRHKQYEEQRESDKQFHCEQEEERVSHAVSERKEAEAASGRLGRMREDKNTFLTFLRDKQQAAHKEELVVFEARLAEARKERLAVRKKQRQEKHRAESEATRKAEEEERIKREREEEQRRREEERQERDAKLNAQARLQREREQAAEEKAKERERMLLEQQQQQRAAPGPTRSGPPERDLGSWRRRDDEEEEEEDRAPPPSRRLEVQEELTPGRRGGGGGGGGGAYRPPAARSGGEGDSWRSRGEVERRGPPSSSSRDDYSSPRGTRREGGGYEEDWRGGRSDRDDTDWRGGGGGGGGGEGSDYNRSRGGGFRDGERSGRRFDDDRPPQRSYDKSPNRSPNRGYGDQDRPRRSYNEERGPRRDDRPSRRGYDDDHGPRRTFDEDRGPRRGYDEDRGPRRGYDEDRGPRTPRRYDDRGDDRPRGRGFDDDRQRGGYDDRGPPPSRRDEGRGGPPKDEPRDWRRGGGGEEGEGWRGRGSSPQAPKSRVEKATDKDEDGFETVGRRR